MLLTEGAEEHIGEGAVHGLGHVDGQNEARSPVERAGNDQQFALQNETHRGRGKTSIGIQKRNDRRHVRAADGDNHHHPENERYRDDYRKQLHFLGMHHQRHRNSNSHREQAKVDKVLPFVG